MWCGPVIHTGIQHGVGICLTVEELRRQLSCLPVLKFEGDFPKAIDTGELTLLQSSSTKVRCKGQEILD